LEHCRDVLLITVNQIDSGLAPRVEVKGVYRDMLTEVRHQVRKESLVRPGLHDDARGRQMNRPPEKLHLRFGNCVIRALEQVAIRRLK
jgi:hypothetical protein